MGIGATIQTARTHCNAIFRYLGPVLCNFVLMKRFLPLFILIDLLFGQDIIQIKTGISFGMCYALLEDSLWLI